MNQNQIAELFETSKQNISLHIINIIKEGELSQESVVKDYLTTGNDGKDLEYVQYYFSCKNWEGEITNLEEDGCYEMKFCDIDNLPKNITPYITKAIEKFKNNKKYPEDVG